MLKTDVRSKILDGLHGISNLPSLPEVVFRVEEIAIDPDSCAQDLASVIETDPAISSRLLKVANSSFYATGKDAKTASIQGAVARLGFREVRKICLALGAMRMFVRPSRYIDFPKFWRHSLTVASGARLIARRCLNGRVDSDSAYVAGLLHEIGTLILDQYFPAEYARVRDIARGQKLAIHQIEQEMFRLDHGEIGAYLLDFWQLPAELIESVRFHHHPTQAARPFQHFCQAVHLADFVATRFSEAGPGEDHLWQVSVQAWEDLGMRIEDMRNLQTEILDEAKRSAIFVAAGMAA